VKITIWDGKTYDVTLREGRTLTEFGDHGVKRTLPHMRSTNAVWWSPSGNSYVACISPGNATLAGYANFGDGRPVVVSINGIGEIRWIVETTPDSWSGDQAGGAAVNYFFEVKEV
jgi:hypothetical protein